MTYLGYLITFHIWPLCRSTNRYLLVDRMKIYQNLAIFASLDEQEFEQGLRWRRKEEGDGLETQHILALCHQILTTAASLLYL